MYTGYTVDIDKRISVHNSGKGSKYIRGRIPVKLVYSEEYESKSEALKREYAIKQLSKSAKERLIDKE